MPEKTVEDFYKKQSPVQNWLSNILMGVGGGLTGQNYIGNAQDARQARAEMEFKKYQIENPTQEELIKQKGDTAKALTDQINAGVITPQQAVEQYNSIFGGNQQPPRTSPSFNPVNAPSPTSVAPLSLSPQQAMEGFRVKGLNAALVPTGYEPDPIIQSKAQESQKKLAGINESKFVGQYNMGLVSSNMYDLSNLLVGAYEEGGAGNVYKALKGRAAMEGLGTQEWNDKFPNAAAVFGKRVEIISKLFPMLTQQIGKEGSVRLIESVFKKLGKTIPDLQTSPNLAISEMEASVQSMYRIQKALVDINPADFDLTTEKGQKDFTEVVASQTNKIQLSKEDKKQLEALMEQSTQPLRDYKRNGNKRMQYFDTEADVDESKLKKGDYFRVGGRLARW